MPFRSERQRRYLHAHEPELAARWERESKAKKRAPVRKRRRKKR